MPETIDEFEPGQQVRVTQQIPQRDEVWTTTVEGEVVSAEQAKTGSWFAHSKDDKLWLDRLVLRKSDGEIIVCNLDGYSHVERLDPPPSEEVEEAEATEETKETEGEEEADNEAEETEASDESERQGEADGEEKEEASAADASESDDVEPADDESTDEKPADA
ncbi:MAG: hypothetical protein R3336_05345 [Phycisphaeraceae bacterium]|nr:hypothetical protein [Phycisphaeraceae bacterium]